MSGQEWRKAVIEYIRAEARPLDKFGHQPRLYALATQIGEGMEYDDDILFAAAWMHDLGVFLGHRPQDPEQLSRWDHVPYTIARSRELLTTWGFPLEKLDGVAEAIRHHQAKDEPTTVEGLILRDADILEQLGAIAVLRAAVKVGRDMRYPTFTSMLTVLENSVYHLAGHIRLTATKNLAQPRVEMLRSFLEALKNEAGDSLY
jgi:uncharacterized protein